jgi:hypothetical protein
LRRFVSPRAPVEVCEMCGAGLGGEHRHLVELETRKILCACDACAILFSGGQATKYKRVPDRVRALKGFQITDAQWDALMIPIDMAFFFYSTQSGKVVAIYPSPAGPIESLLDLNCWNEIEEENPALKEMDRDVEALLVNRVGGAREFYVVPMDVCYRLVGLIRARWRGIGGGSEVREEIGRLFADLKDRAARAVALGKGDAG